MDYPIVIVPLSADDGGGFLGFVPDLIGCQSDGETRDEALRNTELAILEWIDAAEERGLPVPAPNSCLERLQAEKQAMIDVVKKAVADLGRIEDRLDALEVAVKEIEAQFDHQRAWTRFVVLTGADVESIGVEGRPRLLL